MFKYLILVAFIIGAVVAVEDDAHAHVEKEYKTNDGKGHFEYGFGITNGIGADESGDEKQVTGEYHFLSKEGVPIQISYTADAEGYHPHSDSLPTPPPTPDAIIKSLAYIASHPHKEESTKH